MSLTKYGSLFLLLTAVAAHAASFDCAKAATPQEKAICASPQLGTADEKLAAVYKSVSSAAPPEMQAELKTAQQAWIQELQTQCKGDAGPPSPALISCLSERYARRSERLQGQLLKVGGVTFVMRSIVLAAPDEPGDPAGNDEVKPGFGTISVSWPQNKGDSPEWAAWNHGMEQAAQKMASQGTATPGIGWQQSWAQRLEAEITVSVDRLSPNLITATLTDSWSGHGAAHPNTNTSQFNWLFKEKRELHPNDVFEPSSGWEAVMHDDCMKSLTKQFGEGYEEKQWAPGYLTKTLHDILTLPENWQVDESGITIVFQPITVSSRLEPATPVTFSWDKLQPYLRKGFARPFAN
jgi:uncharacterized protein YecT (DUF1311 family)